MNEKFNEQEKLRIALGDILSGEAKFYDGSVCSSTCHFSRAIVILVSLLDDLGSISDEYLKRVAEAKEEMRLLSSLELYS